MNHIAKTRLHVGDIIRARGSNLEVLRGRGVEQQIITFYPAETHILEVQGVRDGEMPDPPLVAKRHPQHRYSGVDLDPGDRVWAEDGAVVVEGPDCVLRSRAGVEFVVTGDVEGDRLLAIDDPDMQFSNGERVTLVREDGRVYAGTADHQVDDWDSADSSVLLERVDEPAGGTTTALLDEIGRGSWVRFTKRGEQPQKLNRDPRFIELLRRAKLGVL